MHGAAEAKIAHHGDTQAIDTAPPPRQLALDGIQVEQGLAGVFVAAIAAIDHRHPAGGGELRHRTGHRVAHGDHVRVSAEHPGSVIQRLALGDGGRFKAGGLPDLAAEQVEGAAKAHPGTGAGFKKHGAEDGAVEHARDAPPPGIGTHLVGDRENTLHIGAFKLLDREDMATGKLHRVSPGNDFRVGPQPVQRALYERPALLPMGVLPKIPGPAAQASRLSP